ncbi:MAG TPA: hypothetical protein VHK00_05515 [Miltoncostaeaceae bacterium]|jgi:hypothetical protein|nr:hypothetical protein [Miltoncostaeaceae bacterium]
MSETGDNGGSGGDGRGVHARLAEEAELRWARRTPSRSARWAGRVLCLALAVGVVVAAVRVGLW